LEAFKQVIQQRKAERMVCLVWMGPLATGPQVKITGASVGQNIADELGSAVGLGVVEEVVGVAGFRESRSHPKPIPSWLHHFLPAFQIVGHEHPFAAGPHDHECFTVGHPSELTDMKKICQRFLQ
jgi:hypothetical protein